MLRFQRGGIARTLPFLAAVFMFAGCATEQKNTHATTALPIAVKGLLVTYQPGRLVPIGAPQGDGREASRDAIAALFQKAMLNRMDAALARGGIPSKTVVAGADGTATADNFPDWRRANVRIIGAHQTCTGLGSCSYQLKVGVSISHANLRGLVWSTEVEEPYMVSSFAYDARYEELTGYVAKAILGAVVREQGAR